jgi:hypothetical protein
LESNSRSGLAGRPGGMVKRPGFEGAGQENILDIIVLDTSFDQCLQGFRSRKKPAPGACRNSTLCAKMGRCNHFVVPIGSGGAKFVLPRRSRRPRRKTICFRSSCPSSASGWNAVFLAKKGSKSTSDYSKNSDYFSKNISALTLNFENFSDFIFLEYVAPGPAQSSLVQPVSKVP